MISYRNNMDFEEFEGYKKILNEKHIRIQEIYELLEKYEENIGELSYIANLDDSEILIKVQGKYDVKVFLKDDDIIIERIIEAGHIDDSQDSFENGKSIPLAHADRIIEQLYDLIRDYIDDGVVKEHITKAQKILKLKQDSEVDGIKPIPFGDRFVITDYTDERKILYKIKQSFLNSSYIVTNLETKREAFSLRYEKSKIDNFRIEKQPFEVTEISRDKESVKTLLKGKIKEKELKISADYSDNHYLIELDEIVIGAVDCLDSQLKREYRLEINDLKHEEIVIAVAIISDYISLVEKKGV